MDENQTQAYFFIEGLSTLYGSAPTLFVPGCLIAREDGPEEHGFQVDYSSNLLAETELYLRTHRNRARVLGQRGLLKIIGVHKDFVGRINELVRTEEWEEAYKMSRRMFDEVLWKVEEQESLTEKEEDEDRGDSDPFGLFEGSP